MSPISARSRRPAWLLTSMLSRSCPSLLGSTPFGWYGPNSGRRLGDPLPRQRYAPATRASRSSIAWHAQSRTPAPSPTHSWRAASSSRSGRASMTRLIHGEDVLQHPGYVCRVRGRPHSPAHARGDGGRPRPGQAQGQQPKLSDRQQRELRRMHDTGDYSISDLAELFSVSRPRCTGPSAGKRPPHSAEGTPPLIAEGHR